VLDLLLAVVAVAVLVAVALALLAAVTLVPFVVALQMADARRFSTARWGAVALLGSALGLAAALVVLRAERVPDLVGLLPLALTWLGPGALWLLTGEEARIGGRAGRHA
jgi:type II secretory pathway component PulK